MKAELITQKTLSCVLSAALLISIVPGAAVTGAAAETVTYMEYDAATNTFSEKTAKNVTKITTTDTVWNGSSGATWFVVSGEVTISQAITVVGNVNLILADESKLTAEKGIRLVDGNSLTIYGQKNEGTAYGQLIATGQSADGAAGIGGGRTENGGTLTINGGYVKATGNGGAGIGGGLMGGGGSVTINRGYVEARGEQGAAGIGGGLGGSGGTVIVNGADQIAAVGTKNNGTGTPAAGIGAGVAGSIQGTVTLNRNAIVYQGEDNGTIVEFNDKLDPVAYQQNHTQQLIQIVAPRVRFGDGNSYYKRDYAEIEVSTYSPKPGEKVTLTIKPQAGVKLTSLEVRTSTAVVKKTTDNVTSFDFTMPEGENVLIVPSFEKIKYDATVKPSEQGTIKLAPTPAMGGNTVAVLAFPNDGYELGNLVVIDEDGNRVDVGWLSESVFTNEKLMGSPFNFTQEDLDKNPDKVGFVMPYSSVTITPVFYTKAYNVNTECQNGTLITRYDGGTVSRAPTDATVNITASPATGYRLKPGSIKVKDDKGNSVAVTNNSFKMPAGDVTVSAEFIQINYEASIASGLSNGAARIAEVNGKPYTADTVLHMGDSVTVIVTPDAGYKLSDISLSDASSGNALTLNDRIKVGMSADDFTDTQYAYRATFTMPAANTVIEPVFAAPKSYVVFYQNDDTIGEDSVSIRYHNDRFETEEAGYPMMRNGSMWAVTILETWEPEELQFVINGDETEQLDFIVSESGTQSAGEDMGFYQIIDADTSDGSSMMAIVIDYKDGGESDTLLMSSGNTHKLQASDLDAARQKKTDYKFVGWFYTNENGDEIQAKFPLTIRKSTYLYAKWARQNCYVTFDDGTNQTTTKVKAGETVAKPADPVKAGYVFCGWKVAEDVYMQRDDGTGFRLPQGMQYGFADDDEILENLTLTANWKHNHTYEVKQVAAAGRTDLSSTSNYVHVRKCKYCDSEIIEAHTYDSNGNCACGFHNPSFHVPQTVTTIIGSNAPSVEYVSNFQNFETVAPEKNGGKFFQKWQYSYDGVNWSDMSWNRKAVLNTGVNNIQLRALYGSSPVMIDITPKVSTGTLEFDMFFQVPEGCTYVDSGLLTADNTALGAYYLEPIQQQPDPLNQKVDEILDKAGNKAIEYFMDEYKIGDALDVLGLDSLSKTLKEVSVSNLFKTAADYTFKKTHPNAPEPEPPKATVYLTGNILTAVQIADTQEKRNEKVKEALYTNTPIYPGCPDSKAKVITTKPNSTVTNGAPYGFRCAYNIDTKNERLVTAYFYAVGYVTYKDKNGKETTVFTQPVATSYWDQLCTEGLTD